MKNVTNSLKLADALCDIIEARAKDINISAESLYGALDTLVAEFRDQNHSLVAERDKIQININAWLDKQKAKPVDTENFISYLKKSGFIKATESENKAVNTTGLPPEINQIPAPQLVVPADKANMVLNALNARYVNLEDALFASNIVNGDTVEAKKSDTIKQRNKFLDSLLKWQHNLRFKDIESIGFDYKERDLVGHLADGTTVLLEPQSFAFLAGVVMRTHDSLKSFLVKHHDLHVEVQLDGKGHITGTYIESALTTIIDLEDASLSSPEHKIRSYKHLKGVTDGTLTCEVRGKTRSLAKNSTYQCLRTLDSATLQRRAVALVREVGPYLQADKRLITANEKAVPEKILDTFMTVLLGMRYHVAPKLHGAEEVAYNVALLERTGELLGLPEHANKIGIMNEEVRTNGQLSEAILAAKDCVFFTNSGFLDYTGSFIDLVMHIGAVDSYRALPSKIYKTSYEDNNVFVSLDLAVPQIGAGMWPKLKDMAGLYENKKAQVKALNDTGWSPSPLAAAIHAMAFHTAYVKDLQAEWRKKPVHVDLNDMFTFPAVDKESLTEESIQEDLNYAIHGLLAYAEPWVRRGVGCSGVKDLGGTHLMEDRATARIKTAFVRNWLLHGITTKKQVQQTITDMAKLVDEQNADKEGYVPISKDKKDEVVKAVSDLVLNPDKHLNSYVEPYLYDAYIREQAKGEQKNASDFMADW